MTKITVEQAVRVVQSATTAGEVQAVLEQCKKDQLHEVFLAVTGAKAELCAKSWKKSEIVNHYTTKIVAFRAREAFKAMDTKARAEYLLSQQYKQDGNTVDTLTARLTPYELIALNAALGVSFEEYTDKREGYGTMTSLHACIRRTVRDAEMLARSRANEREARIAARSVCADVVKESGQQEVSKPGITIESAFKQWEEHFKDRESCPFYAVSDYLVMLDTIAASRKIESEKFDTYILHWYIESGRSSREFRHALLHTDPRKLVKFLVASAYEKEDDQLTAIRIATGLISFESASWKEKICQRKIMRLMASLRAELEVKPDYDAAFDETAYSPDVQDISVNVDDIPADHEPDIAPVSIVVHEAMKTDYDRDREMRKELQAELHTHWQRRHALRKAQRIFGEGSVDAEALKDVWELYPEDIDGVLYQYELVCERLKKWREYEAESMSIAPAPVQEVNPAVEMETPKPKVQIVVVSKPKAKRVYKKATRKGSRKSHRPNWVQSPQLHPKASRRNANMKPLVKMTRAASTLIVKKF